MAANETVHNQETNGTIKRLEEALILVNGTPGEKEQILVQLFYHHIAIMAQRNQMGIVEYLQRLENIEDEMRKGNEVVGKHEARDECDMRCEICEEPEKCDKTPVKSAEEIKEERMMGILHDLEGMMSEYDITVDEFISWAFTLGKEKENDPDNDCSENNTVSVECMSDDTVDQEDEQYKRCLNTIDEYAKYHAERTGAIKEYKQEAEKTVQSILNAKNDIIKDDPTSEEKDEEEEDEFDIETYLRKIDLKLTYLEREFMKERITAKQRIQPAKLKKLKASLSKKDKKNIRKIVQNELRLNNHLIREINRDENAKLNQALKSEMRMEFNRTIDFIKQIDSDFTKEEYKAAKQWIIFAKKYNMNVEKAEKLMKRYEELYQDEIKRNKEKRDKKDKKKNKKKNKKK